MTPPRAAGSPGPGEEAVLYEILHARLVGIVQEMQNALFRTGYSTIIRESQDASCALMDADGRVMAQHTVLPLHLGAFPACAAGVLEAYPKESLQPGDAFLLNHPYHGGSPHANDVAVLVPVFHRGELFGFAGSIAHKSDIGGAVPGSGSGQAREAYQEGLLLPAVRYVVAGQPNRELERVIRANSRDPDLVMGDIQGQVGCCRLGERRLGELLERFGRGRVEAAVAWILELTEQQVRRTIATWPDGRVEGEACIDGEGGEGAPPVRVHVAVTKQGERIHFDFCGSDPQTQGPSNIRPPLARAVCYYALKCMIDPALPSNDGLARVVETAFRPGTLVNPRFPAAVNSYMATAQAVSEAVLAALGRLVPERRIAGSGGTCGMVIAGERPEGGGFVQYELFGSGLGARSGKDGVSGTSVHVGNSRITPIEIIEAEFPVRVRRFELIRDSGGAGRYRGGLGFVREYELKVDATFSMRGDKHQVAPFGLEGGRSGHTGRVRINPGTPHERVLPARVGGVALRAGDVLRIERAGGGGFGDPRQRLLEAVLRDVQEGRVSLEAAHSEYGVAVESDPGGGGGHARRTGCSV